MKFEFNSLQELKDFISFVNQDKDSVIKEASKELIDSNKKLKEAVLDSHIQEGKK